MVMAFLRLALALILPRKMPVSNTAFPSQQRPLFTARQRGALHRNDKEYLSSQLDKSLKTMGVDAVDLFFMFIAVTLMSLSKMSLAFWLTLSLLEKSKVLAILKLPPHRCAALMRFIM